MRFEFCGKLDCPDWILAQLSHASKLDPHRFKLICESVKDTILAAGHFDQKLFEELDLDEERFDIDDARALFGATNYIMVSASQYQVSSKQLGLELEQLGLANLHCEILCHILDNNQEAIRQHL